MAKSKRHGAKKGGYKKGKKARAAAAKRRGKARWNALVRKYGSKKKAHAHMFGKKGSHKKGRKSGRKSGRKGRR